MRNEKRSCESSFKNIFIAIGVIVSLSALAIVVYKLFKKYFQVTFECDGCDGCDDAFGDYDEDSDCEPICCCDDCDGECSDEE